jgi:hypothetical protein
MPSRLAHPSTPPTGLNPGRPYTCLEVPPSRTRLPCARSTRTSGPSGGRSESCPPRGCLAHPVAPSATAAPLGWRHEEKGQAYAPRLAPTLAPNKLRALVRSLRTPPDPHATGLQDPRRQHGLRPSYRLHGTLLDPDRTRAALPGLTIVDEGAGVVRFRTPLHACSFAPR